MVLLYSSTGLLYKRFSSALTRRGKKFTIEKLFLNLHENLNKTTFKNFWFVSHRVKPIVNKFVRMTRWEALRAKNQLSSSNTDISRYKLLKQFLLCYRQVFFLYFLAIRRCKSKLSSRYRRLSNRRSFLNTFENRVKALSMFNVGGGSLFFNILKVYYTMLCKNIFSILITQYLVFQIVFSLIPALGVRMIAVKKKTKLKKKGRLRKSFGVPIVLSFPTQIVKAIKFFKKGLLATVGGKKKRSEDESFKQTFFVEYMRFILDKNTTAFNLKKRLYSAVVYYRINYHFRWSSPKFLDIIN